MTLVHRSRCLGVSLLGVVLLSGLECGSARAAERQASAERLTAALDAERQGDFQARAAALAQALAEAPASPAVHWQLGEVQYQQRWLPVEDVVDLAAQDPLLTEYRQLREQYGQDSQGDLVLARWCHKHGLLGEARAHAARVLAARPDDPELLKLMGLQWYRGQLLTPDQVAEHKQSQQRSKSAFRQWHPRLLELRRRIESASTGERDAALAELRAMRDPAALEAIVAVFQTSPALSREALQAVGRLPGPAATDQLLRQAVLAKRESDRLEACAQLRLRPLHSFVPKLLEALATPQETRVEVARDRDQVLIRQTVSQTGANAKVERAVEAQVTLLVPNPNLGAIIGAVYSQMFWGNQQTAHASARANRQLEKMNAALYDVLERTTASQQPRQPEAWWDWWLKYNELSLSEKPTYTETTYQPVNVPYVPFTPPPLTPPRPSHSCFAKGTRVVTLQGPLAIEQIRPGDRVLAQEPLSGALEFKTVLQVTNGRQKLIGIRAGEDRLLATYGHVFWVSGAGWRMAKDLKVGDRLHQLQGWTPIDSIERLPEDATHNLVVADYNTFFVGEGRFLVHDITMLQPTAGLVPGEGELQPSSKVSPGE